MTNIKPGDRVRRTSPCAIGLGLGCSGPHHKVGWEGVVDRVGSRTLYFDEGKQGSLERYELVEPAPSSEVQKSLDNTAELLTGLRHLGFNGKQARAMVAAAVILAR